jgi:hypothetical protein
LLVQGIRCTETNKRSPQAERLDRFLSIGT